MVWGRLSSMAVLAMFTFFVSITSIAQPYCADANFWRAPIPGDSLEYITEANPHGRLNFDSLKILVWNVYKLGKAGILADLDFLTHQADLSLIQEGFLTKGLLNLACSREDLNFLMAKSFSDKGINAGVITASKENPIAADYLKSPNTEPFSSIHKMTLATYYEIPESEEKLLVLNIHGINFVPHDHFVKQINVVAQTIQVHSGPIIFAGDFNTYTSARLDFLIKKVSSLGLTQAKVKGAEYQGLLTLDHLFYRGLELVKSEALKHVKSSDHIPLFFEFKLDR